MADTKPSILYIGPTKDASGYGEASRNYIRSLVLHGHKVTIRAAKFDSYPGDEFADIRALEGVNLEPDICIQHLSPDQFNRFVPMGLSSCKMVGLTVHETDGIPMSWVNACNEMDLIIVPCEDNKKAFVDSGVATNVEIVPHTFDISKYDSLYPEFDLGEEVSRTTKFYSIFWNSYKKGLHTLLKAFYLTFQDRPEKVSLTLRIYTDPLHRDNGSEVKKVILEVKKLLRLNDYPKVVLLCDRLTDEEICSLHKACDIFVTATRGEGWCIPCFDAMAFGNTPVAANWGGIREYLSTQTGYPIEYQMVPCMGMANTSIYSTRNKWAEPLLSDMMRQMFRAYCDHIDTNIDWLEAKQRLGKEKADTYSHEQCRLSECLTSL